MKQNKLSYGASTVSILSALSIQGIAQYIMLGLSILSFIISIAYTTFRFIKMYKQGDLTLEQLERIKKDVEENIRNLQNKIR